MTQEEKAKAYDEALEKARAWKEKSGMPKDKQGILDDIFPELAESEDERIRKELLEHCINRRDGKQICVDASDYRRWAVWLEKQGNKDILENAVLDGNEDGLIAETIKYKNEKQGEQKPAWSEEDESYLNTTIAYLKDAKEFKKTAENCINWLKSLRPQNRWKPSEEQLNNILDVLSFDNCTPKRRELLESLYNDLKKLRGE